MDKPMPDLMFRAMSIVFTLRDLFRPRERILQEVELQNGHQVLDFGCGPGSYTTIAARAVGEQGKVYAQDIHPLAANEVERKASKMGIGNVVTICSGCETGLLDGTVDVVFLYDIFHMLGEPGRVLRELHRVMKEDAILSVSDHHMKEGAIVTGITDGNLFELSRKGRFTYAFTKRPVEPGQPGA